MELVAGFEAVDDRELPACPVPPPGLGVGDVLPDDPADADWLDGGWLAGADDGEDDDEEDDEPGGGEEEEDEDDEEDDDEEEEEEDEDDDEEDDEDEEAGSSTCVAGSGRAAP